MDGDDGNLGVSFLVDLPADVIQLHDRVLIQNMCEVVHVVGRFEFGDWLGVRRKKQHQRNATTEEPFGARIHRKQNCTGTVEDGPAGKTVANCRYGMQHLNFMKFPRFSYVWSAVLALPLVSISACNTRDNPDEIRQRTAEATESMSRDAKAWAEGVKEGMSRDKKTININKASREDLLTLPDISEHEADRIIAERPYDNTEDMVRRHVVPREEYDKISDRIIAGHYP